jgi:hypothetical protein
MQKLISDLWAVHWAVGHKYDQQMPCYTKRRQMLYSAYTIDYYDFKQ